MKTVSESGGRGGQLFSFFSLCSSPSVVRTILMHLLILTRVVCSAVQTKSFLVSHPSGRKLNQNRPLIILSLSLPPAFLPLFVVVKINLKNRAQRKIFRWKKTWLSSLIDETSFRSEETRVERTDWDEIGWKNSGGEENVGGIIRSRRRGEGKQKQAEN